MKYLFIILFLFSALLTSCNTTTAVENIKPVAILTTSQTAAFPGTEISFDASKSVDIDGLMSSYSWDFGDSKKASGSTVKHSYRKAGNYDVILTVVDDKNARSEISKTIVITEKGRYMPALSVSWQWQLTEDSHGKINTNYGAEIFDLDLFDVDKDLIEELQSKGKKVLCYFSAGSYEEWRSDASKYTKNVLGHRLDHWEGERWVDIRSDLVRSIVLERLDLAQEKGCDGVEPDNMDGYEREHKNKDKTGFDLTASDQIDFNMFIANAAHARGLSVGLKNDLQQVVELVDYFDFAVNEQCFQYKECKLLSPFIKKGKPVLNAEYAKKYKKNRGAARDEMCKTSKELKFSTLVLHEDLDDRFRYSCLSAN